MEGEVWKSIPGWEDTFISSLGRIKRPHTGVLYASRHITLQSKNRGEKQKIRLKTLLAMLFVPNPLKLRYVQIINPNERITADNVAWTKQARPNQKKRDDEEFKKLLSPHLTNYEIADILKVSEKWVRNKLKELGINRGRYDRFLGRYLV
jgi:hypothetical protein